MATLAAESCNLSARQLLEVERGDRMPPLNVVTTDYAETGERGQISRAPFQHLGQISVPPLTP